MSGLGNVGSTEGTGIGLTNAHQIIELHDGADHGRE